MTVPSVLAFVLLQATCAVPLGPGYHIREQEVELHFTPARVGQVHVRARYELENTGNAPLPALAISLPAAAAGADGGLVVSVEEKIGRPQPDTGLQPPGSDEEARTGLAIEFSPAWPKREKVELVLDYDLPLASLSSTELDSAASRSAEPAGAFYFAFEKWFPELIPPDRVFARGTGRAEKVHIRIRVPEGWRALSSGRPKGAKHRRGETEHRFEISRDDFDPFVLAGRYHQQRVRARGQTVLFWTLEPVKSSALHPTGEAFAATLIFLEQVLGPRQKQHAPVWIAALPALSALPDNSTGVPRINSFAQGLLVAPDWELDTAHHEKQYRAFEEYLAELWLERLTSPASSLSPGLVAYLGDQARVERLGLESSSSAVTALLSEYDTAVSAFGEQPGDVLKAQLFAAALQDRVGRENFLAALRRMIQARRGLDWNANDLRAAVEYESGQNLGDFFRSWLGQAGIPEEFRKRYEARPGAK